MSKRRFIHPSNPRDRSDSILDRVLRARPNHWKASELDQVRSYAYKWLLLQKGQHNAQPPDPLTCAQIATATGGAGHACDFIRDNLQDRQAETALYLVTMALQKIHGIAAAPRRQERQP